MFQLHPDPNFHYETIRSLGVTRYFGGDISEQIGVLQNIPAGDSEAWYREWSGLAQQVLATIDESKLDSYSPITVRDVYFRASHYQFVSDFFLHGNQSDPRLYENYALWRKWFDIANAHLPIPGKHVRIQSGHGFSVPAIIYRTAAASAANPRPTIIVHGGFDSNLEEVLHVFGFAALERGCNVVIFEGPGQLGVVHEQKQGWIPDWEKVVTPIVDHILAHKGDELAYIDTTKIGLIGMSLGGYLAARAAAYEPRLAAVILIDGVWSFEDTFFQAFPGCKEAWNNGDRQSFDRVFTDTASKSTGEKWFHDHLLFSSQVKSGYEAMERVVKPMAINEIAERIKMPAFVGLAKNDLFFHGQPEKVAKAIGSNATLFEFGDGLSAGAHCASGALTYQNQRIFEWFAGVVGK